MREKLRKTAIGIIGDVPWGTHFCQFYQSKEDLIEILVPYFKQGLENNEFCMWVTAEPLGVEDAKTALKEKVKNLDDYIRKGQIEILDYNQWYTATGRFEADKVLEGWVEKEKQAIEKGFDGLRLTGNTFWLKKKDWQSFVDYEAVVNSVIGKHRMLAICSYSLDRCQAGQVIDVVNNHQFALIRKEGKWTTLESSERKRMGESLRDSEGRFRAIFDNANDGILLADGELKKFYIGNNTICQMLGYSLEEIKNLGVTDIHLKEDLPYVIGQFEKQSRREIALAKDIPMKRKDGSVFYADVNSSFVTLAGRKYLIGVFRDTTERKKAEEKLRESEERFHIAAETSNDVVYEWDMQHSIQWFGKIDEMLGYGPGEFPRTMDGWTESVHPEDRQRVMAAIQAYLDGRLPYVIEYRIRRKDGAYQWWAARGAAARTPDGHPVRWIGTITDITERKKAEEAMERLSRNLQATVEELTRSNKELQEFVRIAAHDLKTPIRAIGTLADWILTDYKDKLDESGQEKVKLLVGRAKRIDGMINGLLQYSRMGHTRGKGKEVDLNIVLSEVIREIAPPENVEITIQNELPAVICEKRRMVQVFRNLLINSLKYIDKPMGQIRVGCVGEDGFWKFSICDNGCGIEQKYFGKIFKVFQKLTSQDETEGTGIGLAIVRKIVELYGGSVWVESKPEEGSTFFFTLPKQETRPGEVPGRSQMGVKNAKLKACIVG